MKYYFTILVLFLVGVVSMSAQVTNLMVNGSDTNFTFESGSAVSWQYNVPTGATANGALWYDVNGNGSIDTLIDRARFVFSQTDGGPGGDGPPDMDGSANGMISFSQPVGLAPGNWVFMISQGGASLSVKGTITHLSSVAHTVSGNVTPPLGESAANVFMQIQPGSGGGDGDKFWEGITDASGNFTIEMDADTAGNPWRLRFADHYNPFEPNVPTPSEYEVNITGNHSGYNFSFTSAVAKVVGYLHDEDGIPLTFYGVWLSNFSDSVNVNVNVSTNESGYFQIGLAANNLSNGDFTLGSDFNRDEPSHQYLAVNKVIHGIQLNDSLFYNLVAYKVNSAIEGQVKINGSAPGFPIRISGSVQDSAWTETWADSATGNFSLETSNKLYNYQLWASELPENYFVTGVTAHPGQTGVIVNITVTGVNEREPGVPAVFSLGQNYPNPFNPTTTIDYDVPQASHVRLSIYNILGNEVLNVVDQLQAPGKYTATIDASSLSSGFYFYRLTAGNATQTKKMLLMK